MVTGWHRVDMTLLILTCSPTLISVTNMLNSLLITAIVCTVTSLLDITPWNWLGLDFSKSNGKIETNVVQFYCPQVLERCSAEERRGEEGGRVSINDVNLPLAGEHLPMMTKHLYNPPPNTLLHNFHLPKTVTKLTVHCTTLYYPPKTPTTENELEFSHRYISLTGSTPVQYCLQLYINLVTG